MHHLHEEGVTHAEVAARVLCKGSTLVGSRFAQNRSLSEPRRLQDALKRALVDDGKPWVSLSPTQAAKVLCVDAVSAHKFLDASDRVAVELGALA